MNKLTPINVYPVDIKSVFVAHLELPYVQRILERRESKQSLIKYIRKAVQNSDMDSMYFAWNEYMQRLEELPKETKHKEFHLRLINSVRTSDGLIVDTKKIMSTIIEVFIIEGLLTKSYIERNVVAMKIGQKLLTLNKKSEFEKAQLQLCLGLNLIQFAQLAGLCKARRHFNIANNQNTTMLIINEKILGDNLQDKALEIRANSVMLAKPKPHTQKSTGGRLLSPKTMLKHSDSITTQSRDNAKSLNILQSVGYNIKWDLNNKFLKEYSKHDKWYNDSHQLMKGELYKLKSDLAKAGLLENKRRPLYFPVAQDHRGRVYCNSSYVNYQGDKYQKMMLEFLNKEPLNSTGIKYLKISICSEVHSDKITFEQALKWFDAHEHKLDKLVEDNPAAYYLYRDYVDGIKGKPVGSILHYDGTNNCGQIYAISGRDKRTAYLTNLIDSGSVQDMYYHVARGLNNATGSERFDRGKLKTAVYTTFYGALMNTVLHKNEDKKNGVTGGIKEFFPAHWEDERAWNTFQAVLNKVAPAVLNVRDNIFLYHEQGRTKYNYTMPDGFRVELVTKVNQEVTGYYLNYKGETHQGSINTMVEMYNKFDRSLAANIIHSIEAWIMRVTIRIVAKTLKNEKVPVNINTNHDCYGTHPNHVPVVLQAYRIANAMALEKNILVYVLKQINPDLTQRLISKEILKFGDLTAQDIMNSKYALR